MSAIPHEVLGLRVEVVPVPIGSLPRFEGKGRRLVDHRRSRGSVQPPESGRPT